MTIHYVNEYRVSRCYGGPEEGGWWYSAGEFVRCHGEFEDTLEFAINERDALIEAERASRGPGYRTRSSVLGGADTEFYVEDEPGADFPKEAPHYE